MTVAILVKVHDGIVLAADSAVSVMDEGFGTHVYGHGNKVFQLHRSYPLGAMFWGLGNIGSATVATLVKTLRRRFHGRDLSNTDWELSSEYSVEQVAIRARELIFSEVYQPVLKDADTSGLTLGFLVAGYGSGQSSAEAWSFVIENASDEPQLRNIAPQDTAGWEAFAQPEAAQRLFKGMDDGLKALLNSQFEANDVDKVCDQLHRQAVTPPMPIGDAIEFAEYLADTTVGYSRFVLGPNTVDRPIDIAAITRFESFKWVQRKHFYSQKLNAREVGHDY